MHKKRLALRIVLGAAAACLSWLQLSAGAAQTVVWEPSGIDWPDSLPPPTVAQEKIPTLRLGDFLVTLDETKLRETAKHFGVAPGSRGDAGDAESWICLGGSDTRGRWVIWLTTSEINGEAIGGFAWRLLSPSEILDHRCRMLSKDDEIKLPLALDLTMTEGATRKLLGRPTAADGGTLFYCHAHEKTINRFIYTISNDLAIRFRDHVVWAIEVSKSSSN